MKIIRKILLLSGVLMVLLLAGCTGEFSSIDINTTLTVDTSFNGARVMTADIPAAIYKQVFGGDVENIEIIIGKHTPGDMYCVANEMEDGGVRIEMHIDFASKNEYQKKIQTICKGNQSETAITPVVKFDYARSMLKNGYTIEENFTSLDLFYWLSEALIDEYPALEGKNINEIFTLGKTEVVFDGQTTEMDGNIRISNIESNAFDNVTVAVELHDDQSVGAEITYVVSNKIVTVLGDKLVKLMDELVPEDAELTYKDDASSRVYTLNFHADTAEAYVIKMNKALRVNNTVFEISTEGDSDSLSAKKTIRQYYDGSSFLDFTKENTTISYILKVPSEYTVDSCKGVYGYLINEASEYSSDICEITMTMVSSDEIETVLGFAVDIEEVNINTSIFSDAKLERTLNFKLAVDADNLIGSSIQERLEAAAAAWPEEGKLTVEREAILSSVQYRIRMQADSVQELNDMTLAVLGETEDETDSGSTEVIHSSFTGGEQKHRNPFRMHYDVEDTMNLSEFLKGSQVTGGIHYSLTYPKHYKAAFVENTMFEDAVADGAVISCSTYNKILTVRSTAEKANVEGIIIFVLWIVSLLVILVLTFLNLHHILRFVRNGKEHTVTDKIDVGGESLFHGKNLRMLAAASVAVVCFIYTVIRLLFRIY